MVQIAGGQQASLASSHSIGIPTACSIKPAGMTDTEWSKWRQQHCWTFYDDDAVEEASRYHHTGSVNVNVLKDFLRCEAEENNLDPSEINLSFGYLV